jgi:hypothetical protein
MILSCRFSAAAAEESKLPSKKSMLAIFIMVKDL